MNLIFHFSGRPLYNVWQYSSHLTFYQYYFSSSDLTHWGGLSYACDHVSTQQLAAWLVAWASSAGLELAWIAGNTGHACFRAFRHTSEKAYAACAGAGCHTPLQLNKHALRKGQRDAAGLEAPGPPTNHAVDVWIISSKDQIADIMTQRP